jgi:hypothetical protein
MKLINNIKKFITDLFVIESKEQITKEQIKSLEKKTKNEIEKVGRKVGVELDKRLTKTNMIKELKKHSK